MYTYEGKVTKQASGKFIAVILVFKEGDPNCDTVMEHECDDYNETTIWCDDEINRIKTGKGIWE